MLYGFSLEVKEQIRQTINIVDLVGEYIQLTPKGRMYVGLCPWHNDSKPSLQVDPERQTFRCWVCADGGDIFSFMMKMENVSFPEALHMLAERAGIEVPQVQTRRQRRHSGGSSTFPGEFSGSFRSGNQTDGEAVHSSFSSKKKLHEAAFWAESEYHKCFLNLPESHPARVYLNERGISMENVSKFRIGFAPESWNWLEKRTNQNQKLLKDLSTTGYLGYSEERKSYYERFRGRLLFPIHDSQGRSVGIGGRVIPGVATLNEGAKYLNTPETPLFSKHRLLYGLDLARPSIHQKKRVLVMEGYTDTIIAHQYGFTESVAVLGTALGIDHIRILNRLADRIYLILDGDEAGQRRAAQVLELFVAEKVDVQIVTLPEENDPAEYLAEFGAEKFEELIQTRANDALTHAFMLHTKGLEFSNIHQSEQALDKLLGLIASGISRTNSKDFGVLSFREEKMLQQLSFSFSIPEEFLRRRLREIREKARYSAFMRESWKQKHEQSEETGLKPKSDLAGQGSHQNLPPGLDESEAYSGDEETFFDDSFEPDETISFSQNKGVISSERSETASDEKFDYASEPGLLTRESFEEHADEVNWEIFGRINAWEKEIVEILLAWPGVLSAVRSRTTPERFQYVPARELFLRMCEMADDGLEPTFDQVLVSFESGTMKSWLIRMESASIWNHEQKQEEDVLKLLDQIMASFEQFQMKSRKPQDIFVFHSAGLNREQKINLLDQLIQEKQRQVGHRSDDYETKDRH
ncbi:MAG: toprim domain-containing protein [Planctomycetaceae bacterium]|nr:toprim domain-containing protein [Planctomycetaceae bacterium]